ncbi:MAG TPA: hypothetical protein VIR78_06235 [Malonomonas sp.]
MIFLPRGIPVREKVNPARINLPEAMAKLRDGSFTGYLRFDSAQGTGVVIFERGKLVSALYIAADEKERLIAYDAIARIFEISILGNATLNIFRLVPELAIGIHALLHGSYLYRGQDLKLVNIEGLQRRIRDEQISGCLRVYAEDKVVLIFYEQGHSLGFFHDGGDDIVTTADLTRSVARLPGVRFDLLETAYGRNLMLADLMASADLGPIWQRTRKLLLDDRRKSEEKAIRSMEERQELRRQQLLLQMKAIAGNHIGKFGISQVDKAFSLVGPDIRVEELAKFYDELQRLAKLVAGPKKINAMLDEMKQQASSRD